MRGADARALPLAALLLAACASGAPMHPDNPPGRWVVMQPGQTARDLGRQSGIPAEDIVELNGLPGADSPQPGRLVYVLDPPVRLAAAPVPGAAGRPAASPPPPPTARRDPPPAGPGARPSASPAPGPVGPRPAPSPGPSPGRAPAAAGAPLRWPVEGARFTSGFGSRGGRPHEGIDLAAPIGTPVVAAGAGEVLFSGDGIRGYGNLVVLQHPGDLLTVYAHGSELLVRAGQSVAAGQPVAKVGQSGRATAPHLHFEVREGQLPRDPLRYLPPPGGRP